MDELLKGKSKEKILSYNLLILRITSILKIMLVIDNPYGSR